jgi:protein-disulfide isomerase
MAPYRRLSLVLFALVAAAGLSAASAAPKPAPQPVMAEEMSLGNPKAKVTVIEYASASCPHCARFSNEVFEAFKAKYVDTGKVHYVFREVLIHPELDAAGALLVRCVPADKYFATVQAIFRSQPQMFGTAAQPGDVRGALLNVAKAEGMSEAQFQACLSDTKGLTGVTARQKIVDDAKISSTPTFVINGKVYDSGEMPIDKMSEAVDPLLKS